MTKKTLRLEWSIYKDCSLENVKKFAPNNAGVYKISVVKNNGKLGVKYVGQSQDLDKRLKQHLDYDNEENECLKKLISSYKTEFSWAKIANQEDRNGVELTLYNHYNPSCNDKDAIPNGPLIEINYQ